MNKLLIAVMMMAGLTACSQEAKQETQETAQAVASEVKNEVASAADATASAAQEAADKVEATADKAEEAANLKKLPSLKRKPKRLPLTPNLQKPSKWMAKLFLKRTVKHATAA